MEKQGEIIARQQRYLEAIDRKERETNLVITGVPDEDEALEGATSEQDNVMLLAEFTLNRITFS